jgi:hypothetical protein
VRSNIRLLVSHEAFVLAFALDKEMQEPTTTFQSSELGGSTSLAALLNMQAFFFPCFIWNQKLPNSRGVQQHICSNASGNDSIYMAF